MWAFFLLGAVSCPSMHVVSSSVGLAGIKDEEVVSLTPGTLEFWLAAREAHCPPVTLWVEEGSATPKLQERGAVEVKRFPKEHASIGENGYAQLPRQVRETWPRSAMNEPVTFLTATLDQPFSRRWTGPPTALLPRARVEVTPPYFTVRSSQLVYEQEGFTVSWARQKIWLEVTPGPLPIRFVDDGRATLPTEPTRAPMTALLPGEGAPPDLPQSPSAPEVEPGRCTSLALVTDRRGLTALDGRRATPLENLEQATLWLDALRSSGCRLPLTWWHLAGTPPPKLAAGWGAVSFSTFRPGVATWWGEQELKTLPGPLLESSGVSPTDMVVRARVPVPLLSGCADPAGPDSRSPPSMAMLEPQELRVEAPFAVLDAKRLRWSGLESTSGRCTPSWELREVLLRVPPTALPIRLAQ